MRRLTEQESKNINSLRRYPEWQTFQALLGEFLQDFGGVDEIQGDTQTIAAQVIGRQTFKKKFAEFLRALDIASGEKKPKDLTYE